MRETVARGIQGRCVCVCGVSVSCYPHRVYTVKRRGRAAKNRESSPRGTVGVGLAANYDTGICKRCIF